MMETFHDDILITIASLLLPIDLFHLALVCKRFGLRSRKRTSPSKSFLLSSRQRRQQQHQQQCNWPWSIIEETSRRQVSFAKNDTTSPWRESSHLTIHGEDESWMAVHYRLHILQNHSLPAFHRIIGNSIRYMNGDITRIQGRRMGGVSNVGLSIAICQQPVMTCGQHVIEYTIIDVGGKIGFGIIRPIDYNDYTNKRMKYDEFRTYCNKKQSMNDPGYVGDIHQYYYKNEIHLEQGDTIRLTLNCDKSTLSIQRNGRLKYNKRITTLTGHYCWAVTMDNLGVSRPSMRILGRR